MAEGGQTLLLSFLFTLLIAKAEIQDPNEPECDGLSRWKEYFAATCYQCDCRSGKKYCHSILCASLVNDVSTAVHSSSSEVVRRDFKCSAGSRWRVGCNWCRCGGDRVGRCRNGYCVPGEQDPNEQECEGNSEWKEHRSGGKCTACECKYGKSYCHSIVCSRGVNVDKSLALADPTRRDYECTPGSRWRDKCNWCRCGQDGIGICTRRTCITATFDPLEEQCDGVSEWKERKPDGTCRTCECKGGVSQCRSIHCSRGVNVGKSLLVPEYNELSHKDCTCTQGSHWRVRCNWCRCALDSTSFCTSQL